MENRVAEEGIEICDYCGRDYDSNSEGHEHFTDYCECKYCTGTQYDVKGKKFCSPECECHYIHENP